MFEDLNPLNRPTAWLEIFMLMFGAFLIGYLFARYYYKKKMSKDLEESYLENRRLKSVGQYKRADTTDFETDDKPGQIKAIKTRERAGLAVKKIKEEQDADTSEGHLENKKTTPKIPELNFRKIGTAKASEKDDLKKISGIGPAIENKLNGIGIYTFEQISNFEPEDYKTVTNLIEFFPGRIERDNWVGQAEKLK